jgi:hypothetical protein
MSATFCHLLGFAVHRHPMLGNHLSRRLVATTKLLVLVLGLVAAKPWPKCVLQLRPSSRTTFGGSFACSGGTIFAAFHRSIPLNENNFRLDGVKVEGRRCHRSDCLITICNDSRAVITANVAGVSLPGAEEPSVICQTGQTEIHYKRPIFTGNNASAIVIGDDALAHIADGIFRDALVLSAAGFIARGRSNVVVSRSKFLNNTASGW